MEISHVYRYTHNESGKWYIGSHNGKNAKYLGSGKAWKLALKKYGISSFTKEILYRGEHFREFEEAILIDLNAANDVMSYNLKNEALGGSFPGELNGMYGRVLTPDQKHACGTAFRGKKRPDHSKNMSGKNNPAYGKNAHTYGLIEYGKSRIGKSYEEIFGIERAKEIKLKGSISKRGVKHNLKTVSCPHCGKIGSGPNMTRYHFNNCSTLK